MSGERSSAEAPPDDGLNPFSFKEFLRWKALDPDLGPDEERGPEQAHGEVRSSSSRRSCWTFSLLLSQQVFGVGGVACAAGRPFTSERPQEAEQTGRGRSFQVDMDSTFTCREEEEEETRFSRTAAGDETRSGAETATSWKRRSSGRSSEVTQLQEENMLLRRTIRELQKRSKVNEQRVRQLSEELLHRRHQEEEEAQHLESMVQSVEQNLCLMTRRAVRAESSASRLKAELQQLQAEIDSLRSENNTLKTAESEVVMTMRHNAKMASEHLSGVADHARRSLRQLMGQAETLHLVSQLLGSIDRISHLHPES